MNKKKIIPFNNALLHVVLSIFVLCSFSCSREKELHPLRIDVSENGVDFYFNGIKRLSGGKPQIERQAAQPSLRENKEGNISFSLDGSKQIGIDLKYSNDNIFALSFDFAEGELIDGRSFAGFFFDSIPAFAEGVEIWRYKPWNSWTKPIRVTSPSEIHGWDVQFFYWRYSDGLYGAAIPVSGNGFRATLGSENGNFGSKSLTYIKKTPAGNIPLMAIGFDNDPYRLFTDLYASAMGWMGKPENLRRKKSFPEQLEYIGWCTWNSSHMGKDLNEKHLLEGISTFSKNTFPLGWLLIDDGWFNHDQKRLNSYEPDPQKFPQGFKQLVSRLKTDHGLKHVGIWHAFNGYWNGINPDSEIGKHYNNVLFSWEQLSEIHIPGSPRVSYSFIKPGSDSLSVFYRNWHRYLSNEGFSFVKVDNQLVVERMCVDTYPIWEIAERMHKELNASVFEHFDGAIINCMDMTNDAFYNFGESAIARCVEDYFPEKDGGVGYKLENGGAAAHVLSALYNSLYFSQMVWPDFDMFESYNTYSAFHAAARAISGGPVYITDQPGKQHFDVLWPLIDGDGRILRADQPGQLTKDCLFQVQDKKPLKAFSLAGNSGLLAVFNAANADKVEGTISPSELEGLKGEAFAVYEFYSKELTVLKMEEELKIELGRMENQYYNIVPLNDGVALIGLVNKYNAPKTIVRSTIEKEKIETTLLGCGGTFKAMLPCKPTSVIINGQRCNTFSFENKTLIIELDVSEAKEVQMVINR